MDPDLIPNGDDIEQAPFSLADFIAGLPPIVWKVVAALIVFAIVRAVFNKLPWKVVAIALAIILVMVQFGDKFKN